MKKLLFLLVSFCASPMHTYALFSEPMQSEEEKKHTWLKWVGGSVVVVVGGIAGAIWWNWKNEEEGGRLEEFPELEGESVDWDRKLKDDLARLRPKRKFRSYGHHSNLWEGSIPKKVRIKSDEDEEKQEFLNFGDDTLEDAEGEPAEDQSDNIKEMERERDEAIERVKTQHLSKTEKEERIKELRDLHEERIIERISDEAAEAIEKVEESKRLKKMEAIREASTKIERLRSESARDVERVRDKEDELSEDAKDEEIERLLTARDEKIKKIKEDKEKKIEEIEDEQGQEVWRLEEERDKKIQERKDLQNPKEGEPKNKKNIKLPTLSNNNSSNRATPLKLSRTSVVLDNAPFAAEDDTETEVVRQNTEDTIITMSSGGQSIDRMNSGRSSPHGSGKNKSRKEVKTKYDAYGFDSKGINLYTGTKLNKLGFSKEGIHFRTGSEFCPRDFRIDGINLETDTKWNKMDFDIFGKHKNGTMWDNKGRNFKGFLENGNHFITGKPYTNNGFTVDGIHKDTGTEYDPDDCDVWGFKKLNFE